MRKNMQFRAALIVHKSVEQNVDDCIVSSLSSRLNAYRARQFHKRLDDERKEPVEEKPTRR